MQKANLRKKFFEIKLIIIKEISTESRQMFYETKFKVGWDPYNFLYETIWWTLSYFLWCFVSVAASKATSNMFSSK